MNILKVPLLRETPKMAKSGAPQIIFSKIAGFYSSKCHLHTSPRINDRILVKKVV